MTYGVNIDAQMVYSNSMDIKDFENDLGVKSHACIVCKKICKNRSELGWHLRDHGTKTDEYIKKYYYDNKVPDCKCGCKSKVSWHKAGYKYREFTTGHNRKGVTTKSDNYKKRREYTHAIGSFVCKGCGYKSRTMKGVTSHATAVHKLSAPEYTVKYLYNNIHPVCQKEGCNSKTRYSQLSFKRFCTDHAKYASSLAGKKGGKSQAWNRGKTKETDNRVLAQSIKMLGEGNPFFGKTHTHESINQMSASKRLDLSDVVSRISYKNPSLSPVNESLSLYKTQDTLLDIKCSDCQNIFKSSLFNLLRGTKCKICFPNASGPEIEIANFVKSLGFDYILHDRAEIAPLELDIFIPGKRVAIEYHGLYWHAGGHEEAYDKRKHRDKFLKCSENNIHLIQIFGDEWDERKNICKSMISARLGVSKRKINARDCKFKQISSLDGRSFFSKTHVDGPANSKSYFGLFLDSEIVAAMSIRKPIAKNYGNVIEIARMSSALDTIVRGGPAKLVKNISRDSSIDNFDGILTYADLRFGTGGVYHKCGFDLVGDTRSINYWYTDGVHRYHRFKYRGTSEKSEHEIAQENNVRPIHGAGNRIYLFKFADT